MHRSLRRLPRRGAERRASLAAVLLCAGLVSMLAGCSNASYDRSVTAPDCRGVLADVMQSVRGGTTSTIGDDMDWLSRNCSHEYSVATGYMSSAAMPAALGQPACDDLVGRVPEESIRMLYADGLCDEGASANGLGSVGAYPSGAIDWSQAVDHAWTTQQVCGTLVGSGWDSDDLFLNLGRDYPDPQRFQIILWDVGGIEPISYGTTLCASGEITLYQGVAQIELSNPWPVDIYD